MALRRKKKDRAIATSMIPKIIHYCWFGPSEKSDVGQKCIASWEKYCPDFQFMEWSERNTKSYQNKFYRDAYRKKKYAFVADCVRAQALNEFGGVYLDLDMLLLKPLEPLLKLDFFTGDEVSGRAAYGLFGGKPRHRFFAKMKQFYDETSFNQFSPPVITHTFSPLINSDALQENEIIYAPIFLYALSYEDKEKDYENFITQDSIAVHLWDHSWQEPKKMGTFSLFRNLRAVLADYLFHGYPKVYFRRYFKEFGRKLYHQMIGKS